MLDQITTFLRGVEGLIGALTTLLAGLAALLQAWRLFRMNNNGSAKSEDQIMNKGRNIKVITFVGSTLILISVGIFSTRVVADSHPSISMAKQPLNVKLTSEAWMYFNKKEFRESINKATDCINEFQGSANREQAELKGQGAPTPPVGKATTEEQKVIFARGLLNDVATCFYITGRSSEYLGLIEDAKRAYQQASSYTYARTWDPSGRFFWSPAQASADLLSMLK